MNIGIRYAGHPRRNKFKTDHIAIIKNNIHKFLEKSYKAMKVLNLENATGDDSFM